jgi:hypothetical protein
MQPSLHFASSPIELLCTLQTGVHVGVVLAHVRDGQTTLMPILQSGLCHAAACNDSRCCQDLLVIAARLNDPLRHCRLVQRAAAAHANPHQLAWHVVRALGAAR